MPHPGACPHFHSCQAPKWGMDRASQHLASSSSSAAHCPVNRLSLDFVVVYKWTDSEEMTSDSGPALAGG